MKLIIAMISVFCITAQAKFIDEKDIKIKIKPYSRLQAYNLTESEFNDAIAKVQKVYEPIVSFHGGKLKIVSKWTDDTPNANATQTAGNWIINMYGGLARQPTMTIDGFTMVICHEMGHHLGGFSFTAPFPIPIPGLTNTWAANEGQSDYFAAQVCSRKMWSEEFEINHEFRKSATSEIIQKCDQVWSTEKDQDLCYRVVTAGQVLADTLALISKKPNGTLSTPDPAVVTKTDNNHPAVQCRLDTSLSGALCKASFDQNLIPGKKVSQGVKSIEAETEAATQSCTLRSGYAVGLRPTCWFKPRL